MKRPTFVCALLLCVLCAACKPPFAIFEDVGTDPHPPQVRFIGMAYQPVAVEGAPTAEPDLQPGEGFEIRPHDLAGSKLLFRVQYSDAGGDIQFFTVRDRDSSLDVQVSPTTAEVDLVGGWEAEDLEAPDFYSGTTGTANLENITFSSKMMGPHRLEIWAEDSHGSRSEKVTFTVQVVP